MNSTTTFSMNTRLLHYLFSLCLFSFSCKEPEGVLQENKIIITNLFSQEVTGTFYWSHETFTIPVNGTYTYLESGDGAGTFSFGESDSVIIKFEDGKEKTDYNCGAPHVNAIKPECWKDTINLFNSSKYLQAKVSENKFVAYYYITQADYDEAK